MPSTELVADFFADTLNAVFHNQTNGSDERQLDELKTILALSIDAEAISHFILGRYAAPKPASGDKTGGPDARASFLDFAAAEILRMAPAKDAPSRPAMPSLAISNMTMRRDQTRIVASELVWPDGRRLALAWEVAERPGIGLRIEDVNCLGISLRLMLRSAVAQAAAEHPEDRMDLAHLLNNGHHLNPLGGQSDKSPE
ncbi:MAG TPA: hypothetical protein VM659_15635 [Dongiaceae bacterium]|nr:hypothetical protein [Dongiaceae bacterium]